MTLNDMIAPALLSALEKRGYTDLTPVQEQVLTIARDGQDLLVSAQTGSGKTIAFGLAIAPTLLGEAERLPAMVLAPMALIVAPTRELAQQVSRELDWLYAPAGGVTLSCVGGMDIRSERRGLEKGPHIIVGTPGRLRDHIERGSLDLSQIRAVVLDEADEMLDMGFRDDLEFILDAAPRSRRTLMFSATVPKPIAALAKQYQRDAIRISTAGEKKQHSDISYFAHPVAPNDRENAIINLLRYHDAPSTLIFCSTRAEVSHLSARLANRGLSVVTLSGELSQRERSHALQSMRDGRARLCIATDVAARGIDLPSLDLVIHADLPKAADTFLHRSGRTGRAGRKGACALIFAYNRRRAAERLLMSAKVDAQWGPPPSANDIIARDHERMLHDPTLAAAPDESEMDLVTELLEMHGAEKVAAAYLRMQKARFPAPEELLEQSPEPERAESRANRGSFKTGAWFRLSTGRKDNADPRWILPLICRAGHVTKGDVGAIRILERDTRFEISAEAADRFREAIAKGISEKGITITEIDAPSDSERGGKPRGPRNNARSEGRVAARPESRPAARSEGRAADHPAPRFQKRAEDRPEKSSEKPSEKSYEKRPEKPYEKRYEKRAEPRSDYRPERPKEDAPAPKAPRKSLGLSGGMPNRATGDGPGELATKRPFTKSFDKDFGATDGRPGRKIAGKPSKKAGGKRPAVAARKAASKGFKKARPGGNAPYKGPQKS
ncbi:helicase [Iodidimonas nitroreducens]|uniref:Helicase n=1 Tax=Iodidimonas nitroreducens TaxID=1236968 RepID=A0A5A7N4D9_9PROT|nr:DEAD/DEAH box helicase [Iodidimonas nitroreducens]GAK32956.1 DEAD-box ATP-dependent RNA helicase 9 [alpha proteobacterium Q-1]GER03132.1 helicase [Iodidimonas nitroreducens]